MGQKTVSVYYLAASQTLKMNKFFVLSCICAAVAAINLDHKPTQMELEQNKNARYEFLTDVDDHISDLTQKREEVREGLDVKGSSSYSDGYVKRTVNYAADQNGYHIISEETVPLEEPKTDDRGVASIRSKAHGTELQYSVKSVPVSEAKKLRNTMQQ